MAVEAAVLGDRNAWIRCGGIALNRNKEPLLVGKFGQQRSITCMDAGHHRRFIFRQLMIVGQILAIGPEHPEQAAANGHHGQKQQAEQH